MRIAWVTPFSRRSAIARVSSVVTQALSSNNHDVVIIRSERDKDDSKPSHSTSLPLMWWHDISLRDIERSADVVVLNFGDSYEFHAGAMHYALGGMNLGIFHDFFLYNLFNRWIIFNSFDEQIHNEEICFTYGEAVSSLAKAAWKDEALIEQIAEIFPMTEWFARRCGAALAHARFYVSRLSRSCPGPTAVAPLCFESRNVKPLPVRHNDTLTVTTLGVINPNKCSDAIIKSIASSPRLQQCCRFRLVGVISDKEEARLRALCNEVGFEKLDILGPVDDRTLVAELERADVITCLRNPVLEGGSASAIEGMKSGRPIIVADAGFYADLPDDVVFKIPGSIDIPVLTEVLEKLASNEKLRRETGVRARDWAGRTFSVESYIEILEPLMEQFIRVKPLLAVGERVAQQLTAIGASEGDPVIDILAKKMQDLFGVTNTEPGV